MKDSRIIKFTAWDLLLYTVLIAFLYPRGFSEISSAYKTFFSLLTWASVAMIWIQYFLAHTELKFRLNFRCLAIGLYFFLVVAITFMRRGGLSTGLQQMLAMPSLCVFVVRNFKKDPERFLDAVINILLVTFTLNFTVFRGYFAGQYHLTFLGHVQMISQLGMVALFSAILYYMLTKKHKVKVVLLVLITIFTMLTTDADSAVLAAVLLIFAGIIYKWKLYHLLCFKTKWYVLFMLALNLFMIYIVAVNNVLSGILPQLTFSGRNSIWQDALMKFGQSPIWGYGVDGILIQTFWTVWNGGGFTYAHNQVVQSLIDGGIVLFIAFWVMMLAFTKGIDTIVRKEYRALTNAVLLTFLFLMIFDSMTLYCYLYFFLAMAFALPQVLENQLSDAQRQSAGETAVDPSKKKVQRGIVLRRKTYMSDRNL